MSDSEEDGNRNQLTTFLMGMLMMIGGWAFLILFMVLLGFLINLFG